MLQDQNRHIAKLLTATALLILAMISFDRANAFETTLASIPPERCTGYGDLECISLTDWEAGLKSVHKSLNPFIPKRKIEKRSGPRNSGSILRWNPA